MVQLLSTTAVSTTLPTLRVLEMASMQSSTMLSTTAACATQPTTLSLQQLPVHLLELILQHLHFKEQLGHCTHLSKHFSPLTATSLRYATVLLTDGTVSSISRSPRLLSLLAGATSVELVLDTIPLRSRAVRFLLSASNVDVLFPRLAHFRYRLSPLAVEDYVGWMLYEKEPQYSTMPLLPFLLARSNSLRSLHFDQHAELGPLHHIEMPPLLASITSLRCLVVAGRTLSVDVLPSLLALPLDTLDLSTCWLFNPNRASSPPPIASVADCALLRSCRVLHLPILRPDSVIHPLSPSWKAFVEAFVTERTDSTRLHALSVQHKLSPAANQRLVDLPPSRVLSMHLTVKQAQDAFFSRAAASPHFINMPLQLRLSVNCQKWTTSRRVQPFVSFVALHHDRIRSLSLTSLPLLPEFISSMMATVSRCTQLQSLDMQLMNERQQPKGREHKWDKRWTEQRRLDHLHTLRLSGLRDDHGQLHRLLLSCPALRVCSLDLPKISAHLLSALASSCPLLSRLHLTTSPRQLIGEAANTDEEPLLSTITSLRSLTHLVIHYSTKDGHVTPFVLRSLSALQPFLVGSPLRQLTLVVPAASLYQEAVTALLLTLPMLQTLKVASCETVCVSQLSTAWDNEHPDDHMDEEQPTHKSMQNSSLHHSALASVAQASSSLHSLELVISSTLLPVEHLSTLFAHCPVVTSIHLIIEDRYRFEFPESEHALVTLLHCIARIGLHCPLIEKITFYVQYFRPLGYKSQTWMVVGVKEVRDVVDAYELLTHAFAHLRLVREIGGGLEVLSDEADEYVRQKCLSNARCTTMLDWRTAPAAVE